MRISRAYFPTIVMSAYTEFDYGVEAIRAGAKVFMKKPINKRELREKIERLISS